MVPGETEGVVTEGSAGGAGDGAAAAGGAAGDAASGGSSAAATEGAAKASEGAAAEGAAKAGEGAAGTEPPAYTPNFKYKAGREEKEIPEKFRALVKTAEDEKEMRSIFEKADGLEGVKTRSEAREAAYSQLQQVHQETVGAIQYAKDAYARGDLDTFFEHLAIPENVILNYALKKVQEKELPPEQRAQLEANRTAQRENLHLQRQQGEMTRQMQMSIHQTRMMLMNSELDRPELKTMESEFDKRVGREGAFRQEVVNRGQLAWNQSNGRVDLSPRQAIDQVISLFGLKAAAPASAGANGATQVVTPGANGKAGTIPNVGSGRSVSPTGKPKFKSIEDLKKYRESLA